MAKEIVVLHSGGIDSTIMYYLAKEDPRNKVIPVYFDLGHKYAWKEKARLPNDTIVIDVSWLKCEGKSKEGNAMKDIFIPGRNMMLVTLAASKFLPDEVWMGALMGEIHQYATDKNLEFLYRQNELLSYVLSPFKKVKLVFPFVERKWGKLDAIRWGCQNGLTQQILNSSSCLNEEAGHCGRCGACVRRAGIFPQLGMYEHFNTDPWTAPENRELIREIILAEINQDDSHYDKYRREEIIPTLMSYYEDKTLEEILRLYLEEDRQYRLFE